MNIITELWISLRVVFFGAVDFLGATPPAIDISHFAGVFQQRYTKQYNRLNGRRGTLWAHRFKSTVKGANGYMAWSYLLRAKGSRQPWWRG